MVNSLATASPAFTINASDLAVIKDTLTANVGVVLPVGITIMAIMIGVKLIPSIVYKFL